MAAGRMASEGIQYQSWAAGRLEDSTGNSLTPNFLVNLDLFH